MATMDEIERRIESDPEPAIFKWYIQFQLWKPGPFIVCLWWLCILLLGVFYGFDLLNLTVFSFSAPAGTDGYTADQKMQDEFKARINSRQLLLYFKCETCGNDTYPIQWAPNSSYTQNLTESYSGWIMNKMGQEIVTWAKDQGGIFLSYNDFYQTFFSYGLVPPIDVNNPNVSKYLDHLIGYPKNVMLAGLAKQIFISSEDNSAIALLTYDNTYDQTTKNNFIDDLDDECTKIANLYGKGLITVSMTGESALIKAMNEESRKDVEKKDTLTIPLALIVLAFIIRSWRLMFIPLLTFGVSICTSFSAMRPFAEHVLDVNPFCPSIMMSVTIAMSIDYSLFLLSRYREEIERNGHGVTDKALMIKISRDAVRQSTRWSGKVIALSGCILSLTYFGLIFYPMQVLQSVGLGAGLAIVCTILVNLTLTPALLLIFPYFFSQFGWAGCPCQHLCGKKRGGSSDSDSCWKTMKEPLMVNDRPDMDDDDNNHHVISRDDMDDRINNVGYNNKESVSISQQYGDRSDIDLYAAVNKDDPCEKCWYFCGSKTTIFPWSILISVLVYAAIAPIGWQFTTFQQQLADTLIFPRDSPYYDTYNEVVDDFSAGFIAPWYILIFKKEDQPLISTSTWSNYINETGLIMSEVMENVINATIKDKKGYNLTIQGIGYIGTNDISMSIPIDFNISNNITGNITIDTVLNITKLNVVITKEIWENNITCLPDTSYKQYQYCYKEKHEQQCFECYQLNGTYQYLLHGKISDDQTASFYQMTTSFDPYYKNAIEFVSDFRGWLNTACDKYEYECYFSGGSIDEVDSVNKIYANFPTVLGCIVAFVFCLMGLVFKSVFVPFRLFITIAVPMTFVYGLAVMTYQHGMLSGLNMDAFANTDGLYWLIPVMTVTILIGLALDYDIFLFARIYEYRVMGGVPTHEAIVRGVYKTGSIITAAGIIMGIAFCGLLLSKITSLNQTGFIMVIAVLVDTFIIRTSLVPAVLSIAKEVNWWPGLNPKCKSQQELINDMNIRMQSSNINANYSINNAQPLRTGLSSNIHHPTTLDETM